jgi:predicted nucleotidyltransferase
MVEKTQIEEIVMKIARGYDPDKIILFGSYANGFPDENSDLDLLIIKNSQKSRPERGIEVRRLLAGALIPMDIMVYTHQEIAELIKNKYSFIHDAVKTGITLYERQ